MTKRSFLRGALILAIASGISRILGVVSMVLLPRIIKPDGMGLLQLVNPIFYFAAVVAIFSIPTSVSKMVSERAATKSYQAVFRVLKVALMFMVVTGLLATVLMIVSARFLAEVVAKDPGVYPILLVLAPAAFFLAIGGAFRGFFQGMQNMTPPALSQIVDQLIKVVGGVVFALWLMPKGIEYAAAGVASARVIGEILGVMILVGFYFMNKRSLEKEQKREIIKEDYPSILKEMLALAVPLLTATVLWPVMQMLDTFVLPTRLQSLGYSAEHIRAMAGYLGMALTVSQFPNIITVALSTSLIPAISEAHALGSRLLIRRRAEEAVRLAVLFGIPAFVGLFILAEPISTMLFNYPEVGAPLKILAIGTLVLGLNQASNGVLVGLGSVLVPVRNLTMGLIVKLILNLVLTSISSIGYLGAAWGSTFGWLVVALLNFSAVKKRSQLSISFKETVIKPVFAALIMGFSAYFLYDNLVLFTASQPIATLGAIFLGVPLYFLVLMFGGVISRHDIEMLPRIGRKLADFLVEWKFIKE